MTKSECCDNPGHSLTILKSNCLFGMISDGPHLICSKTLAGLSLIFHQKLLKTISSIFELSVLQRSIKAIEIRINQMPSFSRRQFSPLHLHISSYCVSITKYCLSATLLFDSHKTEEHILIVVRVFSSFIMLIGTELQGGRKLASRKKSL